MGKENNGQFPEQLQDKPAAAEKCRLEERPDADKELDAPIAKELKAAETGGEKLTKKPKNEHHAEPVDDPGIQRTEASIARKVWHARVVIKENRLQERIKNLCATCAAELYYWRHIRSQAASSHGARSNPS